MGKMGQQPAKETLRRGVFITGTWRWHVVNYGPCEPAAEAAGYICVSLPSTCGRVELVHDPGAISPAESLLLPHQGFHLKTTP